MASGLFATWPIVAIAFVWALVTEVAVGLPLFVLFWRMGWLSAKGFLLGGAVVALVFFLVMGGARPVPVVPLLLVLVASCVGALVFGYVGGWLTSRLSGPA